MKFEYVALIRPTLDSCFFFYSLVQTATVSTLRYFEHVFNDITHMCQIHFPWAFPIFRASQIPLGLRGRADG